MPTWVVRMVAGVVLGSGRVPGEGAKSFICEYKRGRRVPGEGWPLFDVLADVESGAWVGAGPIIQHHCEVLAIWLRTRLS